MRITLIVADSFAEMAVQPPQASVQTMLDLCPALKKADWQLQELTPTQWMTTQWFKQTHNVSARLLMPANTNAAFCLLPVHLSMQRDSFSLQALLNLPNSVYRALTQQLQSHFAQDFELFPDATQRCWWVSPKQAVAAVSPWPQDCLFQSAFAWQPQGADSHILRQWSNEIQMLLHQLAPNSSQTSSTSQSEWPPLLNSLWFANVPAPAMVQGYTHLSTSNILGKGYLWQGLQQQGLGIETVQDWSALKAGSELRYLVDTLSEVDWQAIETAYQRGKIQQLQCIVPFAERSVLVTLQRHRPWQFWYKSQFWRKTHSVESLMTTLTQQLQTAPSLLTTNIQG